MCPAKVIFAIFYVFACLTYSQAKQVAIDNKTLEIDNKIIGLKAGDSLILLEGEYEYLLFRNFEGSENQYITIINQGKVAVNSQSNISIV